MDFRTFDYSNFLAKYGFRFLGGIFAKPMQYIYEFNFNWLLIGVYGFGLLHIRFCSPGADGYPLSGVHSDYRGDYVCPLYEGNGAGSENAVFMSAVIFIALIAVHIPNIIFNMTSKRLANEMDLSTKNDAHGRGDID